MIYTKHYQTKQTPQSEPIPGTNQVKNSAGGYTWAVDDWKRLDRFLILGSEGGTYYASEKKLTQENAASVLRCIKADGLRAVAQIATISREGRAPKNDPALFALAMAASLGDVPTRFGALEALPSVARTGTHLFQFIEMAQSFRGWGRQLRKAVGSWYTEKTVEKAAYQCLKYRQRNGWTHRDVLRLAHPRPGAHQALFKYIKDGELSEGAPQIVERFAGLQACTEAKRAANFIKDYPSLTWEMVPSELLGSPEVWEALLANMPITAMIRNLGRMSANGLLKPMSKAEKFVAGKLVDVEALKNGRVHPIQILAALLTYGSGKGARGSLEWNACPKIIEALDDAFYLTFKNVEPTGKRTMLCLDVSGSMSSGTVAGVPGLTPRNATAALALVTANVESDYYVMGFSSRFIPLSITAKQRLDDAINAVSGLPFESTDCALPMLWALKNEVSVDTFVIYTDHETWAGNIHPSQALIMYRNKMGIPAKLVTVGMTATEFTIARPDDFGMMDVVGFDTATPAVISDFSRGTE